MGAVASHQVAGADLVGAVRAAHVRRHRGLVLADPGHLVSVAYLGTELAGVFVQQALQPRLREAEDPQRVIGQGREV